MINEEKTLCIEICNTNHCYTQPCSQGLYPLSGIYKGTPGIKNVVQNFCYRKLGIYCKYS
jgi:hypothetical protein